LQLAYEAPLCCQRKEIPSQGGLLYMPSPYPRQ
jgi:hypothetical protein